jgi:hypothetical protein
MIFLRLIFMFLIISNFRGFDSAQYPGDKDSLNNCRAFYNEEKLVDG